MNLEKLNKEQKEAALFTEGPLLILAGAGSGKTQTMTYRIANLVSMGVDPRHILAVTFTNKAAKEMRDRVSKLVGYVWDMWITTFHSMSLRMLRECWEKTGYDKNFVVYDTVDQKALLKAIIKELEIDSKDYPVNYFASIISKEKEKDIDPEDFLEIEGGSLKGKMVYNVYKEYQKRLKANNAMDFDDLLLNCLHLLRDNEDILRDYQNKFEYIMVDEYQDTNHIQYEIIKMLAQARRNLCVVGDDDQCIYEWRGADIRNILDFEKDFRDAKVIKLEQNYRSKGNILKAAHSVIRNNKDRKQKKLWTEADDGHKVVYVRLESDKEEAEFVAREIGFSAGKEANYDNYAVLYRTNAQSRLFEDALKKHGIPYQVLSGFSFYERKETKDMISYMRLIVNPKDEMAFNRIINEPKRGIGAKTLGKIAGEAFLRNEDFITVITNDEVLSTLPSKSQEAVKSLGDTLSLLRAEQDNLRITDIYDQLLVKTGYMKSLEDERTLDAEARIENLLDFKSFIYDFEKEKEEAQEKATLEEFLERVATDSDQDKMKDESGQVTLMTLHSAKGLEFEVVFMPGMEDGLFPGHRSMDSESGMEEERRLCYVGMTRAKEKLYLTSASYRVMFGQGDYTRESTFLRELDEKVLDESGDKVYTPSRKQGGGLGISIGSMDGFSDEPFYPYSAFGMAKAKVKENVAKGEANFVEGDNVKHAKFGLGIVIECTDNTVTVMFESVGVKKLAKGIAPLTKV